MEKYATQPKIWILHICQEILWGGFKKNCQKKTIFEFPPSKTPGLTLGFAQQLLCQLAQRVALGVTRLSLNRQEGGLPWTTDFYIKSSWDDFLKT